MNADPGKHFGKVSGQRDESPKADNKGVDGHLRLSNKDLDVIPLHKDTVGVPQYDRSDVKVGIVHIGPGFFFRSLIAPIMDEIMAQGDRQWGIATVNLNGTQTKNDLDAQDGLYTLVERNGDVHTRVIGSIMESHAVANDPAAYKAVVQRMAHPDTKLFTMTITEGGYKPNDGEPAPAVKLIVDALKRRYETGTPAPTVMSCDNMPENGKKLRHAVDNYAGQLSSDLQRWIQRNVKFPSTMVDRITPSTEADKKANPEIVAEQCGLHDPCAVVTETYRCWVVGTETSNPGDVPAALKDVKGVIMTDDPVPLELTKIRALNGAHVALGMIGHMTGYALAREAMADPEIKTFISGFIDDSLASLPDHIKVEESAYGRDVTVDRIGNEHLADSLIRLPRDCSKGKIQNRVLASAIDLIAKDLPFEHHAFATAAWLEYIKGHDAKGNPFDINDKNAVESGLQAQMRDAKPGESLAILHNNDIFDYGVRHNPTFREKVFGFYSDIQELGMTKALAKFNREHDDVTHEPTNDRTKDAPGARMV